MVTIYDTSMSIACLFQCHLMVWKYNRVCLKVSVVLSEWLRIYWRPDGKRTTRFSDVIRTATGTGTSMPTWKSSMNVSTGQNKYVGLTWSDISFQSWYSFCPEGDLEKEEFDVCQVSWVPAYWATFSFFFCCQIFVSRALKMSIKCLGKSTYFQDGWTNHTTKGAEVFKTRTARPSPSST